MKRLVLTLLVVIAQPAFALDGDMEQRCKDIDAAGSGYGQCACSEPMITNGSWAPGWYDFPGSKTKPCGFTSVGKPLYLASDNVGAGFVVPGGNSAVPSGTGIPYVFWQKPSADSSSVNLLEGAYGNGRRSVPSGTGRLCHRYMFRLSPDWVARNGSTASQCQGNKIAELNPKNFPPQYQWGADTNSFALFYSGPHSGTGGDHLSNMSVPTSACKNNWCGVEQCWMGNFDTGMLSPIARTYVIGNDRSVVQDAVHQWLNPPMQVPTPIDFQTNWIGNLYKQGVCGGERWLLYAAEATFKTADDGTSNHGPWIGPPVEMTGGSTNPPPVLGAPGQPMLKP